MEAYDFLQPYDNFLYWTRLYLTLQYWFFPVLVIGAALAVSLFTYRSNPDLMISPTAAFAINGAAVALMAAAAVVLLNYAEGGVVPSDLPWWIGVLGFVFMAGPYIYIGTLIFTAIFLERWRVGWTLILLGLFVWPLIPLYVDYSLEIGCAVYGRCEAVLSPAPASP